MQNGDPALRATQKLTRILQKISTHPNPSHWDSRNMRATTLEVESKPGAATASTNSSPHTKGTAKKTAHSFPKMPPSYQRCLKAIAMPTRKQTHMHSQETRCPAG
jgi:hypothetical protein